MKLKTAVSKRILELLKEKSITQYELSKRTGVPESTISTIKNASTKSLHLSTLYDICAGLNIDLKDFFNVDYLQNKNLDD